MENLNIPEIINYLKKTQQYRIIEKYAKPLFYNTDDSSEKLYGLFLDVETTGLDYTNDKIIELGMVRFEYSKEGKIFRILEEFSEYQDPGFSIPKKITELTGITDVMVKNQQIDNAAVTELIKNSQLIISHNANFDRAFFEVLFPDLPKKPWACLMHNVDWRGEGIESLKLEYLAYKYGFFYEGHRAITDCLAGIHILSQTLFKSKELVFKALLENCRKVSYKIWAIGAPYQYKDLLKKRGYKWGYSEREGAQAWSIELERENLEPELAYLRSEIYKEKVLLPIDIIDAYCRFSKIHSSSRQAKYHEELQDLKI